MTRSYSLKILCPAIGAALALSACSVNGHSRYSTSEAYSDYGQSAYGEADAYGQYGYAETYADAYLSEPSSCANGAQGLDGLRGGYGDQSRAYKSRYGRTVDIVSCEMRGYWVYPQQQYLVENYAEQAQIASPPVVQTIAEPVVVTACPDGQYRASNGDCAIMITDTPEPVYTPPTYSPPQSFPVSPSLPVVTYEPIRK